MAYLNFNTRGLQSSTTSETQSTTSSSGKTSTPEIMQSSDWHVYNILSAYLQPDSKVSLQDTVNSAVEFYSDGYDQRRAINDVCIELADQIPYDHPSHLKLAQFLKGVAQSENRISKSKYKENPTSAKDMFYQQLSEDLTDNRNGPDGRLDDEQDPMQYVNYEAFLANLMSQGIVLGLHKDLEYAMRDAFEKDHSKENSSVRDAWVMGAAQWATQNAEGVYNLVQKSGNSADKSKLPFTAKEWQSWKDGFKKAAGNQEFGKECREVAEKAADMLSMQDKQDSK